MVEGYLLVSTEVHKRSLRYSRNNSADNTDNRQKRNKRGRMAKRMRDHKPFRSMASERRMVLPQWQAMILLMLLAFVLLVEVTVGHSAVADDSEERSNDILPFYAYNNMAVLEPHRTHGLFRSEHESDPFCAGILVAAEFIVTTRSCVTETGEARIGRTTTGSGTTRRAWDKMWSNDDIGVLHLTHPVHIWILYNLHGFHLRR
jgi:hypothetical protein